MVTPVEKNVDCIIKPDGRKARSTVSRVKIVQAFLQLIGEGKITPRAEEVAKISGVGLRTVFRRFNEMELLYRELVPEIERTFEDMIVKPLEVNTWQDQLHESLIRKCAIYDKTMCYRVAIVYHSQHSPFLKDRLEKWLYVEEKAHKQILPFDYAENRTLYASLQAATSSDTWAQLRNMQNLSKEGAFEVMKSMKDMIVKSFIEQNPS
ncbi:hypothetical protein ESZ36_12530 [Colwellia demingiae]|uniref:TetR/AcrR family transcriptional regulator n=1 Tax=Colwellia demingiae TaxID=89401 RepID=A0A5C6QH52_9GAMM|nr:hypothetical protein [Colwellia demingiae]TWX68083.1 hypothetical protein ESZ36_12530 [Colwellia demingiae]